MRGWAAVVACAAALVVSGCSSDEPAATPPPETPPSTVVHPKAEVPKDRDGQAVLSALRRLDPCSLLDTARGAVAGYPPGLKPLAEGPFYCYIVKPDRSEAVYLSFGAFPERLRFEQPLQTIGQAKAYVRQESGKCTVSLPVSFTTAIQFLVSPKSAEPDPCAAGKAFAAVAAGKLAQPDAIQVAPSWDACSVLRTVAGESHEYQQRLAGMDSCEFRQDGFIVRLSFSYDRPVEPATETVGGARAAVQERNPAGDGCDVAWRQGAARTTYPADGPDLVVSFNMVGCDRAKTFAEQVMKVLASAPPEIAPQRPLLYKPSEPDVAVPGGCAFWTKPAECQPYVQVAAPSGKAEILRAAQADPNVDCRLSVEAVAKHYTEPMYAVTVSEPGCQFVESTRAIRIAVGTSPTPLGKRDRVNGDREATVGGRPARVLSSENSYTVRAALSPDGNENGTLQVKVEGPAEARDVPKVEGLVVDILTKFFS
jgi:hypothetical protein